jgi:hypothetical protein
MCLHTKEAVLLFLFTFHQPALQKQASTAALATVEFEFAGHERHPLLSCAEYEPASQLTQLDAVVFEYVPAAQAVHTAALSLGLNLPGRQRLHAPFDPDQPALQEQLDIAPLPTTEYELFGHNMHLDLSSAAYVLAVQYTQLSAAVLEYLPTAHAVHFAAPMKGLNSPGTQRLHSPFDPDQPAGQEQLEISPLPITEYEFAGHHMHADLSSAAYLPAAQYTQVTADELEIVALAQCVHAIDPLAGLYVPAAQATQSEYCPDPDQPALQEQLETTPLP